MEKELLLLLLIGIPFVLVVQEVSQGNSTGAVTNDIATLRVERLKLISFPAHASGLSNDCQLSLNRLRDAIRINGDERYYDALGLRMADLYFTNERDLYTQTIALLGLQPALNNTYVGATGLKFVVTEYNTVVRVGPSVCPDDISRQAADLLNQLVAIDTMLVQRTIDKTYCPDRQNAYNTLAKAQDHYHDGNYDLYFNTLYTAWQYASSCNAILHT